MRILISIRSEGFPCMASRPPQSLVSSYMEPLCEMLCLGDNSVVVDDPEGLLDPVRFMRFCTIVNSPLSLLSLPHLMSESDAAMLIGYPAMWGAEKGALPLDGAASIRGVRVNGRRMGPIGLEVFSSAVLFTPVILIAGDDFACFEAEALFDGERPVICELKESLGARSFAALQGGVEVLMEGAKSALWSMDAGRVPRPDPMKPPYRVSVELTRPEIADAVSLLPMSRRVGACEVSFETDDPFDVRRFLASATMIADRTC
ncbi:MAG: M55 family metallopeptidase [Thermanaerothrix sp.]|nr:M55 family metallopeptidase [Thermanaerothrix sp.]